MKLKRLFSIVSVVVLIALLGYVLIPPSPIYMLFGGMRPAPRGIHGLYGKDTVYTIILSRDDAITRLKASGFILELEQLHEYDPKDAHRRFEIRNLICGQDTIRPLFDFLIDTLNRKTQIELLWIEGKPIKDEQKYSELEEQFHDCFENQIIEKLR